MFFEALGRFGYRRRWAVLVAALGLTVFSMVWGTGVFGALSGGGFDDPASDSYRAGERATERLGRADADVILLYDSREGLTVDDRAFRRAVETDLAGLPAELVTGVTTYWSTQAPALVAADRTATYAVLQLAGADEDERLTSYEAVEEELHRAPDGVSVEVGGDITLVSEINHQVERDIQRAEALSMPLVLLLLTIVFGGLAAASLPLAIGALAVLGSFTMLHVLTLFTDVSVFSINVVTMLGLGLAIDYALFVVSRFRDELRLTGDVELALVHTMRTAGRTVAFSGITVAISLASLLLFPQVFLRSMGIGGMSAVLIAMVGALTVLPALLAVLGPRVNSLRIPRRSRHRARHQRPDPGTWFRIAHSVMRRPLLYVAVIVPVLILLGAPFLRVVFGTVDHRMLPEGSPSRVVAERLESDFPGGGREPIEAIVRLDAPVSDPASVQALEAYVGDLRELPAVESAEVTGAAEDTARVEVRHAFDDQSEQARDLLADVRATAAPPGGEVLVDGATARLADLLASLAQTLPWMALWTLCATLVLLFLAFGSVVLPVKAVLMNVLSLTASFGAIVWIFQDGNLSGLLGFTVTGTVEAAQPILMLAIAFGLSMDYEVFLLSRVREQWDRTGDNAAAVATGLQQTGGIITSAALLLALVFGAFATSGITFIKMIGVGMVLAILIDATVVRTLLVPASMQLLGRANWWAPAPLARFWARYGVREGAAPDFEPTAAGPTVMPRPRAAAATAAGIPSLAAGGVHRRGRSREEQLPGARGGRHADVDDEMSLAGR